MKSFVAQALILARPGAVWDVLTDTGNYAVWDSGILDVSGDLRHGETLRVRTRGSGRKTLRFRVRIVHGKSVTWTRTLSLGLARITRTVTLTDHSGFTHLHVRETTSGPLAGLLPPTGPGTDQLLHAFADAVKFRSELLGYHIDGGIFPAPHDPAPHATPSAALPRHQKRPHASHPLPAHGTTSGAKKGTKS